MRIEYHRTLIADRVRVAAFHEALRKLIRKGETVVVDIGTGTGLLAFLAAKLGAKKVYAYEMAEIGAVAERLRALNKLRNVELIPGRSTEIIDPPKGDVVVTETLGNYALEEFLVETMNDARARHLKPGGVLVPGLVEQFVCPVTGPRFYKELCAWDDVGYGLDLAPARAMSLNNVYVRPFKPADLLGGGKSAVLWDTVDFGEKNRLARRGEGRWTMRADTTIHGFALWWNARLAEGTVLSTSPLSPPTHWEQLYFPVQEPLSLKSGETLVGELRSRSSEEGGTDLAWSVAVLSVTGRERTRQILSLTKGFLP